MLKTKEEGVTNCIEESNKCFIQNLTLGGYLKLAKQRKQEEHSKQKK